MCWRSLTRILQEGVTLSVSDFIVPKPDADEDEPGIHLSRPRIQRWTSEQIERYWFEPHTIIADIIAGQNEKTLEEILNTIP